MSRARETLRRSSRVPARPARWPGVSGHPWRRGRSRRPSGVRPGPGSFAARASRCATHPPRYPSSPGYRMPTRRPPAGRRITLESAYDTPSARGITPADPQGHGPGHATPLARGRPYRVQAAFQVRNRARSFGLVRDGDRRPGADVPDQLAPGEIRRQRPGSPLPPGWQPVEWEREIAIGVFDVPPLRRPVLAHPRLVKPVQNRVDRGGDVAAVIAPHGDDPAGLEDPPDLRV